MTGPFAVGDGATYQIGSDSYSVTVRRVTKTIVETTNDRVKVTDGRTLYVPDDNGTRHKFTRRNDGMYRCAGYDCGTLIPGRSHYRDPSF